MKLKNYQEKALDWLGRYYERCRALQEAGDRFPVATAFTSITAETVTLPAAPAAALPLSLIGDVTWDAEAKTLRIERPLSVEQETALVGVFADAKTKTVVAEACSRRAGRTAAPAVRKLSPSQRGEVFAVPVLAVKQGDFFRQFEADDLDAHIAWTLSESNADLMGFLIPTEQRGIRIDIADNEKLQQDFIPLNDAQQQLLQSSAAWPVGKLVDWLDRSFSHPDLTESLLTL